MSRALLGALILLVVSQPAAAKVPTFPASFQTTTVQTDGAIIYARVGGQGPAVVMLHGFAGRLGRGIEGLRFFVRLRRDQGGRPLLRPQLDP